MARAARLARLPQPEPSSSAAFFSAAISSAVGRWEDTLGVTFFCGGGASGQMVRLGWLAWWQGKLELWPRCEVGRAKQPAHTAIRTRTDSHVNTRSSPCLELLVRGGQSTHQLLAGCNLGEQASWGSVSHDDSD